MKRISLRELRDYCIVALTAIGLLLVFEALAVAHQSGDPFVDWMNSLTVPGVDPSSHPGSCCGAEPSNPDCRVLDDADVRRSEDGHYSVRDTTGKWMPVEPGRVSNRMDNPTGHFVACIHQHMDVMCFFNRAGI